MMFTNMKYSLVCKVVALVSLQACFSPVFAAPVKPQSGGSYTVKSGDTFAKIARSRGISLGSLLKANNIANPDRIVLGQKIVIPGAAAPQAKPVTARTPAPVNSKTPNQPTKAQSRTESTTVNLAPPAPRGAWTVRTGDTLSRIQRETGTPISTLMRLNGLTDTSTLRVGQTLRTSSTAIAKTTPSAAEKPSRFLKETDTPRIIEQPADKPQTPPATGTPVVTKAQPVLTGTASHKVENGETFSSIRRMYGITETQLANANRGVNSSRLRPGQTLIIPGQPVRSQPKPQIVRADGRVLAQHADPLGPDTIADSPLPPGRTRTGYLVEQGESLEEIARRFHTTEGALRSLNRLSDSDNVYPGRYILVPFLRQEPAGAQLASRRA